MDPRENPSMEMPVHGRGRTVRTDVLPNARRGNEAVPTTAKVNPDWGIGSDPPSAEQIAKWEAIKYEVSPITDGLFLSGFPDKPVQDQLERLGIGVIFSTTRADPPELSVPVVRVPFDDNANVLPSKSMLASAATDIAFRISEGDSVLVHCLYGLNRSALLAAHALAILYPTIPGEEILNHIRRARPGALHNALFAEAVTALNPG